jgi:beta-glucanase (GH16 family)
MAQPTSSTGGGTSTEQNLLWSEDFVVDGTLLNSMTWNVETGGGGWGNGELQTYTAENAKVADGSLQITAMKQTASDGTVTFTSSRVNTADKVEFQYGKVVARIQVPSVTA